MNIKKLLFPFSSKETNLKNYLWHRLFAVIFYILLVVISIIVFLKLNNIADKGFSNCFDATSFLNEHDYITKQRVKLENDKSSYDINFYNEEKNRLENEWNDNNKKADKKVNDCLFAQRINKKLNIGLVLLSTILLWYLLQVIYYKVLLYIVLGNKKY